MVLVSPAPPRAISIGPLAFLFAIHPENRGCRCLVCADCSYLFHPFIRRGTLFFTRQSTLSCALLLSTSHRHRSKLHFSLSHDSAVFDFNALLEVVRATSAIFGQDVQSLTLATAHQILIAASVRAGATLLDLRHFQYPPCFLLWPNLFTYHV